MIFRVSFYIAFGVFFVSGLNTVKPGPYKYTEEVFKSKIWPQPQYVDRSRYYFSLTNPKQLKVTMSGETCEFLTAIVERFITQLDDKHNYFMRLNQITEATRNKHNDTFYRGPITHLDIHLKEPCDNHIYPHLGMDESYVTVFAKRSDIYAGTVWGVLRAYNSFFQAFYYKDNGTSLSLQSNINMLGMTIRCDLNQKDYIEAVIKTASRKLGVLHGVRRFFTPDQLCLLYKTLEWFTDVSKIVDYPRYAHRGLLIDTSRHHISLHKILKTLDAMNANNLNVLHWHIVDDQSFPYQSEVFPDLSDKGAYHSTLTYSKKDIERVVKYARSNGIRVLPEFDVPGHTRSWGNAFPDILTQCYSDGKVVGLGPMDPTKNATFEVLESIIKELQERFPDKYLHVGGDEVDLECWASNPDIKKYMEDNNMTVNQLHALFMKKVLPLLGNRLKPVVWQEVFDQNVPLSSDTLVQVWKGGSVDEMVRILEAGHRLIFSSSWHLDQLEKGYDWLYYYNVDPRQMVINKLGNTSLALLENIVGGEACMWGEVVDDTNILSRVWPRASAVGERLWSAPVDYADLDRMPLGHTIPVTEHPRETLDELRERLEKHVCRMQRFDIYETPLGPGYCH